LQFQKEGMETNGEALQIEAAKRDPARFGPLYERYFGDIFRFLARRTAREADAADLAQQTFLKAMLALPRYRDQGAPFRAWLYRIALNEVRMYWRSSKGKVYMDLGLAETLQLMQDAELPNGEEDLRALETALGRLREAPAALIEMRYFDGMSFAEIGQVLGISEDAAKMRTHRVLGALRSSLERKA